jgi:hypothetical protein
MREERLVLRLPGLKKSDARELAASAGPDARILPPDLPPLGGYGDLGTRTVAVPVGPKALHAVAKYVAARQRAHDEEVTLVVEIEDPLGSRSHETVTYKAAPGQSTVEAATAALRSLPSIAKALDE